jgi:NitT/TauT family transport system ATP-binding protein
MARDEPAIASAQTSAAPVRIDVRDLSKSFQLHGKEIQAVDRVSFSIRQGEFVALLGPSGCGKSTILNIIAGLIPASGGEMRIDDKLVEAGRVMPHVGYVFQRDTVFPWRTVDRNIGYGLEIGGVPRAERELRVARMVEAARLKGFENAFPLALSGGMRQRVSLMRTLIMEPQILLMDEPFGALDTHTKLEMHDLLLGLWERERQTVIFVTHDLSEALTLADRIILLSARPGRLKQDFSVPFPRPRQAIKLRETAEYGQIFARIWHSLGEEFARGHAE